MICIVIWGKCFIGECIMFYNFLYVLRYLYLEYLKDLFDYCF